MFFTARGMQRMNVKTIAVIGTHQAVPEELEMKLGVFMIFDPFANASAAFASNTSSLSIADFTNSTASRDRSIGMVKPSGEVLCQQ